jgi:beta-lactamase regulating signal transducer with metallopeptidase domain
MTSTITETALALADWVELSILSKATVLLVLGLTAALMAGRARASVRHLFLATTFAAILALPLIAVFAPPVTFDVPVLRASASSADSVNVPQSEVLSASTASTAASERRTPRSPNWSAPSWPTIARLLWVAGALMMLVSPAVGLWRLRRIRREGLPWPELRQLVQSLANSCGIRRAVEVLIHEEIPAPLTFGVLRPAIVLPCDAREWDEADLRRALVHELEHVRRGDWAMQLFARTTCAFYWFHPLVWVAWRRLRLEAERASDDAVAESSERTEYAEQLVSLARRLSRADGHATLGMANRSDLSARVSTLLDETQRRGRAGLLAAVSAMCVATLVVLAVAPVRAVAQSTKPPSASSRESGEPARDLRGRRDDFAEQVKMPQLGQSIADGTIVKWLKQVGDPVKRNEPLFEISTEQANVEIPSPVGGVLSRILTKKGDTAAVNSVVAVIVDGFESTDRALFEAAERGDISNIERLLIAGAKVNCILQGDGTPLIAAALNDRVAAVRLLLDRGADPNLAVSGDGNPLIVAAREGHLAVVALLLERGADPNLAVLGDGNPLIMAAREGHAAIVALLLDHGASIDKMVPEDENALIQASGEGHLNVVKLLIARGANVNARAWTESSLERPNGEWRTPLSMARKGKHETVIAFLVAAGARD